MADVTSSRTFIRAALFRIICYGRHCFFCVYISIRTSVRFLYVLRGSTRFYIIRTRDCGDSTGADFRIYAWLDIVDFVQLLCLLPCDYGGSGNLDTLNLFKCEIEGFLDGCAICV